MIKRRISFVLFILCLISYNCIFAMDYTEDNGAFWYQKAFESLYPLSDSDDFPKIRSVASLKDFNELKPETKLKLKEKLSIFLQDLTKAKSLDNCVFWKMPLNDEDKNQFQDSKMLFKGFSVANTLAWQAVSQNEPAVAMGIWQTMLDISSKLSEHNIARERLFSTIIGLKKVLESLGNYFNNGAPNNYKKRIVQYLKQWPESTFDMNDVIKTEYEYQKTNIDFYANNIKYLAQIFGARTEGLKENSKPVIIKNKKCEQQLRIISSAIEMYQMNEEEGMVEDIPPDFSNIKDRKKQAMAKSIWQEIQYLKREKERDNSSENNIKEKEDISNKVSNADDDELCDELADFEEETKEDYEAKIKKLESMLKEMGITEIKKASSSKDFPNMPFDDVIKQLKASGNIRKDENFVCPENGNRTIKAKNAKNLAYFEITCDCGKEENPKDDFISDSEPMTLAKKFRNEQFDFQKKQFFNYFEKLLKIDHSKPMSEEETKSLTAEYMPEYKNNALLKNFTFGYKNVRKNIEERQKLIKDFIKTYDD